MSDSVANPVTIHLIRHGETAHPGRLLGRTDHPTTAAGIARCVQAAEELEVGTIVTSDLIRASACATAIAVPRGLSVRTDPRWRELDFGEWDDFGTERIDPGALGRFWEDPDRFPPPSGERWSELVDRVGAALTTLDDATLVVTHGGAMRAALAVACGFDVRQVWAFDLPYAAVLSLRLWRGEAAAAQIVALRA